MRDLESQLHSHRALEQDAAGLQVLRYMTLRWKMAGGVRPDWRELCKAASQEQDSSKLLDLVHQLNQALSQLDKATGLAPDPDVPSESDLAST
jgi:hypothetical protein